MHFFIYANAIKGYKKKHRSFVIKDECLLHPRDTWGGVNKKNVFGNFFELIKKLNSRHCLLKQNMLKNKKNMLKDYYSI